MCQSKWLQIMIWPRLWIPMMSGFQVGRGIRQRHISRTESTSDLATEVAKKLMAKAGITGGAGFYHSSYYYSRFDDALYSCSCPS